MSAIDFSVIPYMTLSYPARQCHILAEFSARDAATDETVFYLTKNSNIQS